MSSTALPAASAHPRAVVLADLLPAARTRDVALVVGGAALTGVAAQLAVPVPGSPVPVTGQTFAALLVGASLGTGRAFLSLLLYTLAGMAGMPWFADGASGYGAPSFGYVIGMMLAATAVGALARRGWDRTAPRTVAAMTVGMLLTYGVGVPYLALAANMTAAEAVDAGLVPFLVGDALKLALAMGALPAAWRIVGRR